MRSNRTNRQALKQEFQRLKAENAALKQLIAGLSDKLKSSYSDTGGTDDAPLCGQNNGTEGGGSERIERLKDGSNACDIAPALIGRGFPTRSKPIHAKSLSEAKQILLSHIGEW